MQDHKILHKTELLQEVFGSVWKAKAKNCKCTNESERMNGNKLPKYSGKKSKFSMFAAKAKAYLAMKFLGPMLNWTFKNSLPANDQVLLDRNKPEE
jgi:hypothetical protein